MSCAELVSRFQDFWKDFNAENKWRFPELSPSGLQKWLDLDPSRIDDAELARAEWMWSRKPRSPLGTDMFAYILLLLVALLLFLVPHFGIFLAAAWCLVMLGAIAHDAVRTARWRRVYEASMVRVIRRHRRMK